MKKIFISLLLISCLIASSLLFAPQVTEQAVQVPTKATIYNDSHEQITVRMRFRDLATDSLYWSNWTHVSKVASITSKNPGDSIFGFAMLGEQAAQQLINRESDEVDSAKGMVYLISDFRSTSNKHFTEIGADVRITIRDAKIEISATLAEQNIYWTGEYSRS